MVSAYKRSSALTTKKVMDFAALEDRMMVLQAEKTKADQKYFQARKDQDIRTGEIRSLRAQNAKSSEIIAQLKDAESASRGLLSNMEKQLSEMKSAHNAAQNQIRTLEQRCTENGITMDGLKTQVGDLSNQLKAKDASLETSSASLRKTELEVERLQLKLEDTKKSLESWKSKGLGNQANEYEMLRVCVPMSSFSFNYHADVYLVTCSLHGLPLPI